MAVAVALTLAGLVGIATHPAPSAARAVATYRPASQGDVTHVPARHAAHAPRHRVRPTPAWVSADVATVWKHPRLVSPVDRLAVAAHPKMRTWLSRQSLAAREALVGRVLTQTLRGERVLVLVQRPGWSKVRILDQRGSFFRNGIPGWVPTRQLTRKPLAAPRLAPVVRRPTVAAEMRVARAFLGTPYLWGGMSRAGIDCSGLTYRVFRALGIVLPRDAADQSKRGHAVRRRALRAGDLVYFGSGGRSAIHHVGIYAGHGQVLHAPHTGAHVRLTPLRAWSDYWGARRLLHSH